MFVQKSTNDKFRSQTLCSPRSFCSSNKLGFNAVSLLKFFINLEGKFASLGAYLSFCNLLTKFP